MVGTIGSLDFNHDCRLDRGQSSRCLGRSGDFREPEWEWARRFSRKSRDEPNEPDRKDRLRRVRGDYGDRRRVGGSSIQAEQKGSYESRLRVAFGHCGGCFLCSSSNRIFLGFVADWLEAFGATRHCLAFAQGAISNYRSKFLARSTLRCLLPHKRHTAFRDRDWVRYQRKHVFTSCDLSQPIDPRVSRAFAQHRGPQAAFIYWI